MKISNTATDCQISEVILREQRQICRERFSNQDDYRTYRFYSHCAGCHNHSAAVNVDPNEMAIADRLKGQSKPSFGTDEFGRDLMIRVLYGAKESLFW